MHRAEVVRELISGVVSVAGCCAPLRGQVEFVGGGTRDGIFWGLGVGTRMAEFEGGSDPWAASVPLSGGLRS